MTAWNEQMVAFEELLEIYGDRNLGADTVARLWDEKVRENAARLRPSNDGKEDVHVTNTTLKTQDATRKAIEPVCPTERAAFNLPVWGPLSASQNLPSSHDATLHVVVGMK